MAYNLTDRKQYIYYDGHSGIKKHHMQGSSWFSPWTILYYIILYYINDIKN